MPRLYQEAVLLMFIFHFFLVIFLLKQSSLVEKWQFQIHFRVYFLPRAHLWTIARGLAWLGVTSSTPVPWCKILQSCSGYLFLSTYMLPVGQNGMQIKAWILSRTRGQSDLPRVLTFAPWRWLPLRVAGVP